MFKRNVGWLAWTASAVVVLGVAAGASAVVPSLVSSEETPAAISSETVGGGATVEAPPAEVAVAAEVAAPAPEVTVPEVTVPEPEVVVTTPPTTKAPKVAAQAPVATTPPTVPAPTLPPVPALPVLAPRTVPSAAQVQAAISRLSALVGVPAFLISAAHIADGGNRVCTGFDQGQTFAQVKATGLAQVASLVTVTPAAADETVRTAVAMYCPAYASKLV